MNASTLVIVSDLHLGGGTAAAARGRAFSDEFSDDAAFSDFLRWISGRRGCRLVLLGDSFDFLRVPVSGARTGLFARNDAEAVGQLDRIAAAHPAAVEALSATLAAGVELDFVSGNHDAELIRPAVRERLCELLGGRARFHPWILYIPGLLYAEHGHHHHDINAFARPLYPYAAKAGRLERPPAAWLGDLRRLTANPHRLWRDAMAGVRVRSRAGRHTGYFTWMLPAHAEQIGLPERVVADLHHLASFSPFRIGRRLARTRLRRRGGPGYLPTAAAAVRELMVSNRLTVPFYAFGHTHDAMRLPLGRRAWYLNSGTWSTTVRGSGHAYRTWIEITADRMPAAGGLSGAGASLFRWTGAAEQLPDHRISF